MLIYLRKFLLLILMLLQLFAPLVHAHAHTEQSLQGFGVHLPELEVFTSTRQQAVLSAVNSLQNAEGVVVGIHAGMQHKPLNIHSAQSLDNHYPLLPPALALGVIRLTPAVPVTEVFPTTQIAYLLIIPPLSSRAPPIS